MKRVSLLDMLGHPHTQSAVQQLAQGIDPRLVAAQLAGTALTEQIAKSLGAPISPLSSKSGQRGDSDVIDAEYTVINVSPGVKHRKRAV